MCRVREGEGVREGVVLLIRVREEKEMHILFLISSEFKFGVLLL